LPMSSWSPPANRRNNAEPTLPLAPVIAIRNETSQ
jgi:hypothetical protein